MEEYLINQLIQEPNKKSFTPEIDFYDERFLSIESRNNKLATNKVFRNANERKIFLKIYSKMRKILRHGNQFDVASEIIRYFTQAKKDGLFSYIYQNEWKINRETGLYEKDVDYKDEVTEQIQQQHFKRCEFLHYFGLKPESIRQVFDRDVFICYFLLATPAAIVQMKKRLEKARRDNRRY